jgi:hypothetical protein
LLLLLLLLSANTVVVGVVSIKAEEIEKRNYLYDEKKQANYYYLCYDCIAFMVCDDVIACFGLVHKYIDPMDGPHFGLVAFFLLVFW